MLPILLELNARKLWNYTGILLNPVKYQLSDMCDT